MNTNLMPLALAKALVDGAQLAAQFRFGDSNVAPEPEQAGLQGNLLYQQNGTLTRSGSQVQAVVQVTAPSPQVWREIGVYLGVDMVARFTAEIPVSAAQTFAVNWILPLANSQG